MTVGTTASVPNLVGTHLDSVALETLFNTIVLDQFAVKKPLEGGVGMTIQFNRFTDLGYGVQFSEGSGPTAIGLSTSKISGKIAQKGMLVDSSELLDWSSACPLEENAMRMIGKSAANTLDACYMLTFFQADTWKRRRGNSSTGGWANPSGFAPVSSAAGHLCCRLSCWLSGLSSFGGIRALSGSASADLGARPWNTFAKFMVSEMSGTAATCGNLSGVLGAAMNGAYPLQPKDVAKVVEYFGRFNIPRFDDGYYVGIVNSRVSRQLRRSGGTTGEWMELHKYSDAVSLYKGEIGAMLGVRFIESEAIIGNMGVSGVGGKVFAHLPVFFGKGAYGITSMDGKDAVEWTRIAAQKQRGDELGTKSTYGFKLTGASAVLNQSAGVIVLCTT